MRAILGRNYSEFTIKAFFLFPVRNSSNSKPMDQGFLEIRDNLLACSQRTDYLHTENVRSNDTARLDITNRNDHVFADPILNTHYKQTYHLDNHFHDIGNCFFTSSLFTSFHNRDSDRKIFY